MSIPARTASLQPAYLSLRSKRCPEGTAVTYLQHSISLTAISVMRYQSEATNGLGVHEAQLRYMMKNQLVYTDSVAIPRKPPSCLRLDWNALHRQKFFYRNSNSVPHTKHHLDTIDYNSCYLAQYSKLKVIMK